MTARSVSTQNARIFATLRRMADPVPEIGARIRAARKRRGWTQLQFALEAGVSPSTVQRWERGELPRLGELKRAAGVLGIPTSRLAEEEDDTDAREKLLSDLETLVKRLEEAVRRLECGPGR
jgi:transcriptional regulator with XRE-family HTH domain